VLNQRKNSGFAGEKVDTLETCLALSILAQTSDSSFIQTNQEQVRSPSQMELNILLEHYQNGRYAQLENLALDMTRKYPDHQFGWKALGAVYKQVGRLTEAISANQIAVELSPKDSEVHNNLGIALHEIGRLEEAQTCYQKAITIKPEFAEAHNNLGNTLKELGRLEEAQTSYQKAIAIKPEYAEAHNNLGETLKELYRLEEAEVSYRRAIALNPDLLTAIYNLSVLLIQKNRHKDGLDMIRKARGCIFFDVVNGIKIK
jgi:tetratricopeptide (TPR) repeat protein